MQEWFSSYDKMPWGYVRDQLVDPVAADDATTGEEEDKDDDGKEVDLVVTWSSIVPSSTATVPAAGFSWSDQ